MPRWFTRLRARIRNRRFDAELREEIQFHEDLKRGELEASGLPHDDARAAARRAMGNVTLMQEDARRVWIGAWLDGVVQDVRYAGRTIARQPGHALVAVVILVLGIGVNGTLFSLFKAIALDPWPVRDPSRVVRVWAKSEGRLIGPSPDEYRFLREHARAFAGLAAHTPPGNGARLQVPGRAEIYLPTVWASANFFDFAGTRMHLGSGFIAEDDIAGNRRAPVVISHAAWRTHFGSDHSIIGMPVSVAGKPFTLVGVLDPSFDGLGRPVDMWMPLSALSAVERGGVAWEPSPASAQCCIGVLARVAEGVEAGQAREELQLLHNRFTQATGRNAGTVEIRATSSVASGGERFAVFGLFAAAVLLVLVLACANVGNLQLARGLARRRELATRMSIGASRSRIVRQLLTEGLVLAAAAGALAVALSALLPRVLYAYVEDEAVPEYLARRLMPDVEMVVFTLAVSVAACLAFALAPAIHATRGTIPLGSLDRGSTRAARFHLRGTLLATQIAICAALLVGASLVTRGIVHALSFDPGFDVGGVSTLTVAFPTSVPLKEREAVVMQVLDEMERHAEQPVAVALPGPLDDQPLVMHVALPRRGPLEYESVLLRRASSRFFDVLGIPLVSGRMYARGRPAEAVVNEAFERRYYPGESAVGQPVRDVDRKGGLRQTLTIVGVVRDAYLTGLDGIEPVVFTPFNYGPFLTRGGPAGVERVRAAILAVDPAAVITTQPLKANLSTLLEESRTGATLAWVIGLLGLALAAVGVFGVFAYSVEERRREIGLRLALGATRRQILGMLVSTSGRAMVAGLALGLLASFASGPVLGSYLYGLSPLDPIAYGAVVLLLATAAMVATLVPARRACRVDPAVTLRED